MKRVKSAHLAPLVCLGLSLAASPVHGTGPTENGWTNGSLALARQGARLQARGRAGDGVALAELYRLHNLARMLEQPYAVRPLLEAAERAPRFEALALDHVRLSLAELLHDAGEVEGTDRLLSAAGVVREAWLIGPFDNAAGGGHDLPYAPELGIDLQAVERGRNHPVQWRRAAGLAPFGPFFLSELLRPESEATAYVLFAVESRVRVKAALRLGASDRVKVFLDGREIFAADTQRPAAWDQEAVPILLEPGAHSILVKVSYTEARGELRVRLTAPNGGAASGLTADASPERLERALKRWGTGKAASHSVRRVRDALDRALANARGAEASELYALRSDLVAILALHDERKLPPPPEVDLEEALKLTPNRVWDRFFLAHRVQARDPSRAREQLEAALALEPGHVPSLWKLASAHARVQRSITARALLEDALEADPSFAPAVAALLTLDEGNRFRRRLVVNRLRQGLEHAPTAHLHAELATRLLGAGFRAEATRHAEAALQLDGAQLPALRTLFNASLAAGDLELARSQLEREIRLFPWRLAPRLERARLLIAEGGAPEAGLLEADELAQLFPDAPELQDLRAELLQRLGRTEEAVAALDQSLILDPQRPEVRRHKDALAGASSQLEDTYSIEPSSVQHRPVEPGETKAGAASLADRTAVRLYDNGQATRFRQTIVRLTDVKMRDALRADRVYYSPTREVVEILSAERIRPSGVVEKAARIGDSGPSGKVSGMYVDVRFKTIQFQDLEPGDLVHLRYRVDSIGSNIFGGFFGDTHVVSERFPKYDVLYVAESPAGRPLHAAQVRAPAPRVQTRGHIQHTEWHLQDVPALELEPMGPSPTELATTLSVSTYASWGDLAEWFARLFKEQLELDETARRAAHEVTRGATNELEKVKRLHDYVVKNTRYVGIELGIHGWKPFKASEVHRRRYGDCKDKATLLSAMLNEVGVEATVTLIRTVDRGPFIPGHASMWAFNHAITYVPSLDLFLDGTAEHAGSQELPWQDQGGTALVVFPDGRSIPKSPPESSPEANLNRSDYAARLRPDGALELSGVERFLGARASSLRQEMQEAERRREQVEQHLNQILPGAEVSELEFSNLSDIEAPVEYRYRVRAPRYGQVEGQTLILPATLFQHRISDSYASLAERKTALVIEHAWTTNNRVEYELPPGLRIALLPEDVEIDSEYLRLEQKLIRTERGFVTDDTVTFKKKRVPPDAYPDFRRAALEIDRALGRRVVLSR